MGIMEKINHSDYLAFAVVVGWCAVVLPTLDYGLLEWPYDVQCLEGDPFDQEELPEVVVVGVVGAAADLVVLLPFCRMHIVE